MGLEQFIGNFSLSATIDRNLYRIKLKEESNGDNIQILNKEGWSSHFYFGINTTPSKGISVSIRPFVQIQWTDFRVGIVEAELELSPIENEKERPYSFGIQFLFTNGN